MNRPTPKRATQRTHIKIAALSAALLLTGVAGAHGTDTGVHSASAPDTQTQLSAAGESLTITLPDRASEVQFTLPETTDEQGAAITHLTIDGQNHHGVIRQGRSHWTLPARAEMQLTLPPGTSENDLTVSVKYDTGLTEALLGTVPFTELGNAAPQVAASRQGLILTPAAGATARGRSSVNVTTAVPSDAPYLLTVGGQPVSDRLIGRRIDDADRNLTIREYIAVPLQVGENVLVARSGETLDEVRLIVAGSAASARVTPREAVADGFTPVTLDIDVTDAAGQPTLVPYVTVERSGTLTLSGADADSNQSGYQINTSTGRAVITFQPVSTPLTTTLTLDVNGKSIEVPLTVAPARKRNVIAVGSATVSGLGTTETNISSSFQATVEAPLLGGQLAAYVDTTLAHNPTGNLRTGSGDSSNETRPVTANGPFAARYDRENLNVTYARNAAVDPLFSQPDQGDALNITAGQGTRFSASYAPYARSTLEAVIPLNSTRTLALPTGYRPGNTRLFVETRTDDNVTTEQELFPGRDYATDEAGIVTLARPLVSHPENGLTVRLIARTQNSGAQYAPGAQVAVSQDLSTASVKRQITAGAHHDTDATTFGVRYEASTTRNAAPYTIDARLAGNASGYRAQIISSGKIHTTDWNVTSSSESSGFEGKTATGTAASVLTAQTRTPVTATFSLRNTLRLSDDASGTGARLTTEAAYAPGAETHYSAGVFGGTGTLAGFGVTGAGQWRSGPWTASASGTQNFTTGAGTYSAALTHRFPLAGLPLPGAEVNAGIKATATTTDAGWSFTSGAVLTGRAGPYTATVEYGLPSQGSAAGELRGSVSATLPVTDKVNVGASANFTPTAQSVNADARYKDATTAASVGVDVAHTDGKGLATSVRFAAAHTLNAATTGTTTPFGVTADGLSTSSDAGTGHRYSVGLTYRGEQLNAMAYARYRAGTLTSTRTGEELTGEINATYTLPNGQIRGGLAAEARPNDPDSLTLQLVGAYRHWLTGTFGAGVAYRALYRPAQHDAVHSVGAELTYRFLPGAALSAGYNFGGFSGFTAESTRPGLYARLDFIVDDTPRSLP